MNKKSERKLFLLIQASIILVFFVYMAVATTFLQISCKGCILCGMTHAFKYAFALNFDAAYQSNRYVFIALGIFALLGIDMLASYTYIIINKIKGGK